MTFTLGRAGLASASGGDGLTLRCSTFQTEGDEARVTGVILGRDMATATALADFKALRGQLEGYNLNTDEPVVPVTESQDSSRDGFYRVQRIRVESEMTRRLRSGADGNELAAEWSAELLRVPGWQAPLFEVSCSGASRVNGHSITELDGWCAIPGTATAATTSFSLTPLTTTLVGGGSLLFDQATNFYSDPITFSLATSSHYMGAPLLTQNGRTVVGRQILNDPDGWVLSNGLVKVRPSLTEVNHFVVGVANNGRTDYDEIAYRFGAWDLFAATQAEEFGYDGSTRTGPSTVQVLRNSPECVAIRCVYGWRYVREFDGGGTGDFGFAVGFNVDYTLRRGQTYAEIRVSTDFTSPQYGIWRATTDSGTSITGGVENNAADGAGNKYRIYTSSAKVADTTDGGAYINAIEPGETFAVGNDRALYTGITIADQFYAAQNHRQRVVAR